MSEETIISDKKDNKAIIKISSFFLILILFALLIKFTPISEYANKDFLVKSRENLRDLSQHWWFSILFIFIYITGVVISFPGLILTMAGGIIFGTFKGTLLNVIGSNIGTSIAFFIGRYLGRDIVDKLVKGKMKGIDESIEENGFMAILRLRLIPLVPFNVLNYASGFSKIKYKDYALGSMVGMLPSTFIYTFFSNAILIDSAKQKEAFTKLILSALLLIILSFVPNIIKKITNKIKK